MKPRTVYKRFKKNGQTMHNYFTLFEKAISDGSVNLVFSSDQECESFCNQYVANRKSNRNKSTT